jgi:cytochrome P450
LGVIAAVALYEPAWLRLPAILATVGIAGLLWRTRPSFGIRSGLPPGSLYPLPERPWSDPEFYARQARRYGDVFKMCQFGRPMVCVVGLDRADRLLQRFDDRLEAPPLPFSRFIEGGYLRYLPEEIHARYRKLFYSVFHSNALTNAEPRIRAAFRRGFEQMVEDAGASGSIPIKKPILSMMFNAWSDLFYGIDEGHADFRRLQELFRVIDSRKARWAARGKVESALGEIESILKRRVTEFSPDELEDPSCFFAALVRADAGALADRTVLGNMIYIMQVTWGDVGGLLLWIFKMLSDNPAWKDRLARERSRELATRVVLETLRLEQSESRYRRATDDLEFDGFRIPKGWLVRMCVRESHRDPGVFPEPATFNPGRFDGRTYSRTEYGPFGAYRLACIGNHVAMAAGALFAMELTSGFDWRVTDDGPAQISSWVHNAPNSRLRVAISPGSDPR